MSALAIAGVVLDFLKDWAGWIFGAAAIAWAGRQGGQIGRARVQLEQAQAAAAKQKEMQDADARGPRTRDDVIDRLRRGGF